MRYWFVIDVLVFQFKQVSENVRQSEIQILNQSESSWLQSLNFKLASGFLAEPTLLAIID